MESLQVSKLSLFSRVLKQRRFPTAKSIARRYTTMGKCDVVLIDNLQVAAITGKDFWGRPSLQPISISVDLKTDFNKASESDDLKYSLNYAVISRNIQDFFERNKKRNFKTLATIADEITEVILDEKKGGGFNAQVTISNSKSEIRANNIKLIVNREKENGIIKTITGTEDLIVIRSLKLLTLIGVFTFERLQKQIVELDLVIKFDSTYQVHYHKILDEVTSYVENANFKTVEALIEKVAQIIAQHQIIEVTAKVRKPNAIMFADGVGVQVTRTPQNYIGKPPIFVEHSIHETEDGNFNLPTESSIIKDEEHNVYIAFGSNTGDQLHSILTAIELLNSNQKIQVIETSSLYASEPMYHLKQPKFLNGVFRIKTRLEPRELLTVLKDIEYEALGRVKVIENGPRSIDLDILLYDDLVLNEPDLTIPHISMIERTFVLHPLCELVPPSAIHPVTAEPFHNHLQQLYQSPQDPIKQKSNLLKTVLPLNNKYYDRFQTSRAFTFDLLNNEHKTLIMGILNTTPDSFSDGGKNASVEIAVMNALEMIEAGVDIIDIGGVSTRPGSIAPSEEEEWKRIVPIVKAIRGHEHDKLRNVVISIDTYRANIALESIKEGADIINDISGGLYDSKMFKVIADTGVPYILNHTRGTPDTMSSLNQYRDNQDESLSEYVRDRSYDLQSGDEVLLHAVSRELSSQYQKAVDAGVKRWQIITDPGIGFAKNLKQNLAIIRGTPIIKSYSNFSKNTNRYNSLDGLPILLGPSRKKFIGHLTNETNPADRVLSTGAVIMSCIGYKADIVRVHDVEEVKKVTAIGDALYRGLLQND